MSSSQPQAQASLTHFHTYSILYPITYPYYYYYYYYFHNSNSGVSLLVSFWPYNKQLAGTTNPEAIPSALAHKDLGNLFLYVSFTSFNFIPLHGLVGLQSNFTAISLADVPWISSYLTSLTFTPEACTNSINQRREEIIEWV